MSTCLQYCKISQYIESKPQYPDMCCSAVFLTVHSPVMYTHAPFSKSVIVEMAVDKLATTEKFKCYGFSTPRSAPRNLFKLVLNVTHFSNCKGARHSNKMCEY